MVYWKVQLIDNQHPNRKMYANTIFFTSEEAHAFKKSYTSKMKEVYTIKVMRFKGDGHNAVANQIKKEFPLLWKDSGHW